jgi:hypothetical protein
VRLEGGPQEIAVGREGLGPPRVTERRRTLRRLLDVGEQERDRSRWKNPLGHPDPPAADADHQLSPGRTDAYDPPDDARNLCVTSNREPDAATFASWRLRANASGGATPDSL